MQNNSRNFELISHEEMLNYVMIDGPPDVKHCEHLLRGWMRFVAPLTPSNVNDISRLKCVQDATNAGHYPRSIALLLDCIATAQCCTTFLCASTIPLVKNAWPTMWIWIQYVYSVHRHAKHIVDSKVYLAQIHEILVKMMRMFSEHDNEPMVTEIISSHSAVVPMMVDMWIMEGTDRSAAIGFRSADFGNSRNDSTEKSFLVQLIIACGTAEEAVHIACLRVERHLGQAQWEYDILCKDLNFFARHLCRPFNSPLVQTMYDSSRVVTMMMHAWEQVTSHSCKAFNKQNRDGCLYFCLFSTLWLWQKSPPGHDRIFDVLYCNLLPVLKKSFSLIHSSSIFHQSFTTDAISMLRRILGPATVHRKVISFMGPWITANQAGGELEPSGLSGNPELSKAWLEFTTTLRHRGTMYGLFKASNGTVLLCGNSNCVNHNNTLLRRCSACKVLLYCSKKCQVEHWFGHKGLCKDMQGSAKGCVDLSYPDLRFLSYLVACNMVKAYDSYLSGLVPGPSQTLLENSPPAFYLNYIDKPGGVTTHFNLADLKEMQPLIPFTLGTTVHEDWLRSISAISVTALLVLVRLPRVTNTQVMTATVHIPDGFSRDDKMQNATYDQGARVRWLHCKIPPQPRLSAGGSKTVGTVMY